MYSNLYSDDIKSSIEWGYNNMPFTQYIYQDGEILMESRLSDHSNTLTSFKVGLDETSKWVDLLQDKYKFYGNLLISNKQEIEYYKDYIKFTITVEDDIIIIIYNKIENLLMFKERNAIKIPLFNFKILLEANKFFLKQIHIYKNAQFKD